MSSRTDWSGISVSHCPSPTPPVTHTYTRMFAVAAAPVLGLRALPARRVQSRRCAAAKVVRASQQPFAAKAEAKVAGAAVAGAGMRRRIHSGKCREDPARMKLANPSSLLCRLFVRPLCSGCLRRGCLHAAGGASPSVLGIERGGRTGDGAGRQRQRGHPG